MLRHSHAQVAVLGSGLTGSTVALELSRAGRRVTLIEQDAVAMNRSSLRNEGKIHLGMVYAAEESLATASLMLDGALSFRRLVTVLLDGKADALATSTPFAYLVANDSILTPAQLGERYDAIESLYCDRLRDDPRLDYLGRRPPRLVRPVELASLRSTFRIDALIGAFETEELAIDTERLAVALRAALASDSNIRLLSRCRIESVARDPGGFHVEGCGPLGAWHVHAEQVVNCLWENRLRIDAQLGVGPSAGWVHRLKYRVIARLPPQLRERPSVTMVQGPFGDVVVRPDGYGYFSWYPVGMRGWSHQIAPPDAWNAPCRGEIEREVAEGIARAVLVAVDAWYPGAADAVPVLVDAGTIVAYGQTDVDDPGSGLHGRTRVGVASVDGYHTVDPGKLTTAPLFGIRAARQVLGTGAA